MLAYAICTTPRTGGYFLDGLLRDAGYGLPDEYLLPERIEHYCRKWRITEAEYLATLWQERSRDGVFGVRFHWTHRDLSYVAPDFTDALPSGDRRWIMLHREDVYAQARSLLTAIETGEWLAVKRPYLDVGAERVERVVRRIERQNEDWHEWLSRRGLPYLTLRFEDVTDRPDETMVAVREWLG